MPHECPTRMTSRRPRPNFQNTHSERFARQIPSQRCRCELVHARNSTAPSPGNLTSQSPRMGILKIVADARRSIPRNRRSRDRPPVPTPETGPACPPAHFPTLLYTIRLGKYIYMYRSPSIAVVRKAGRRLVEGWSKAGRRLVERVSHDVSE